MVNKADYIAWRDSAVTQSLLTDCKEAIESIAAELLTRELPNIDRDTFLKGHLKGLEAVLSWRPEFAEDNHEG
jgi:hypothetical protein